MPNIDTWAAHLARSGRAGPGNMLGRLRAAAAPLVLGNGNFYTANDLQPRAAAAVVVDGRITFVGATPDALRRAPPAAEFQPGGNEKPRGAAKSAARARRRRSTGRLVDRQWLDRSALVANSQALQRAGIDRNTRDPPGGSRLRDATGMPTGMLIDNAMSLVERLLPPPSAQETARALEVGARRSVQLDWTQLQIAGNSFDEVEQLCRLDAAGRIQLRLYDAIYGPSADAERLLREGPDPQHCGGKLAVRGIKLHIDGALGSRGAALLEPYSDSSGSRVPCTRPTRGPGH